MQDNPLHTILLPTREIDFSDSTSEEVKLTLSAGVAASFASHQHYEYREGGGVSESKATEPEILGAAQDNVL